MTKHESVVYPFSLIPRFGEDLRAIEWWRRKAQIGFGIGVLREELTNFGREGRECWMTTARVWTTSASPILDEERRAERGVGSVIAASVCVFTRCRWRGNPIGVHRPDEPLFSVS